MSGSSSSTPIDFTIGSRRLVSVPRRLATWAFSLEEALAGTTGLPAAPEPGRDGLRVLSAPVSAVPALIARFPRHVIGARQDYPRHYIAMAGSFEDYMARFSGKTRSTLRRKARKLEETLGTGFAITQHRSAAEMEDFLDRAAPLSARTYQARLLGAGLPEDTASRKAMIELAEQDKMRGFLLEGGEGPLAYLALPVDGTTLVYAHLGYDSAFARHSPGTVLQMRALESLFGEGRFTHFDFTEGDGAHKALFATHSVDCASFALLSPTLTNRALVAARSGFDASVAGAKTLAVRSGRSGTLSRVRSFLRA